MQINFETQERKYFASMDHFFMKPRLASKLFSFFTDPNKIWFYKTILFWSKRKHSSTGIYDHSGLVLYLRIGNYNGQCYKGRIHFHFNGVNLCEITTLVSVGSDIESNKLNTVQRALIFKVESRYLESPRYARYIRQPCKANFLRKA